MHRSAWFLVALPLSTLLVLLILLWNQGAIAEAFGPFGRLGLFVMTAVIVATDVGAVSKVPPRKTSAWPGL